MTHTWDPAALPDVRRRARSPLRRPARPRRRERRRRPSSTSAAVPATSPGCSPSAGPSARVTGLDSSPEMIAAARAEWRGRRHRVGASPTCATGVPAEPVDVLVSNATLQWVPDHLALLPRLVGAGRARAVGSRSRCPATSTSRATPSAPRSRRGRRTPPSPRDVAVPVEPRPARLLRGAGRRSGCESMRGRRPTCTC